MIADHKIQYIHPSIIHGRIPYILESEIIPFFPSYINYSVLISEEHSAVCSGFKLCKGSHALVQSLAMFHSIYA